MRRQPSTFLALAAVVACLAFLAVAPRYSVGQPPPIPPRDRGNFIFLPSYYGGGATPLSTVIQAQAAYIEAAGDYLESAAIARRHNAAAAEHEMRNALLWVDTYFEMREKNRAWRLKEDPNFLMNEAKRQEVMKDRIDKYFQNVLKGDVTEELNWLLRELSGPAIAYQYMPGDKTLADSNLDVKLGPRDLHLIRLADSSRGLTFASDEGEVLRTNWPRALRGPEFDEVRAYFEKTRDEVLKELKDKGKLSWESEERLMEAVDRVARAFIAVNPREVRLESGGAYVEYMAGKRFVQALAAGVYRAINTEDRWMLDGSLKFTGDSVVDLLHHMYQNGLEFAPPQTGAEGTYRKLFLAMRGLYLGLAPDTAGPAQPKGP